MKRVTLFATVLALFAATAAMLPSTRQAGSRSMQNDSDHAASAPFRDGLYLGKLAAQRGEPVHVATGRWSADNDRTLFAAGYEQGYNEVLASRFPSADSAHR